MTFLILSPKTDHLINIRMGYIPVGKSIKFTNDFTNISKKA